VNTAGFVIHSAIHMARHDVMCVAHTHTVPGIALSCLKEGLLPVSQHAMRFFNRVSYHDWEGVATNLDERERLVQDLGPTNMAMILRNHGLLTCGRSIQEAWKHMFYLEKSAESQLAAMAAAHGSGKKLLHVSEEVGEYTAEGMNVRSNQASGNMDWPALQRLQDVKDPSYKH
jgi:ribulose-5-phosphate 4-epimerase/fuculose-1-phosphate aldolase